MLRKLLTVPLVFLLFLPAAFAEAPPKPKLPSFPVPAKAVPLDVTGETQVVVKKLPCLITAAPGADLYFWAFPDAVKAKSVNNVLTLTEAPNGTHKITVLAYTSNFELAADGKTIKKTVTKDTGEIDVTVGSVAPTPDPKPPGPTPDPTPMPQGELRVLIVYESEDLPKLPDAQRAIVYSLKVRKALDAACADDGARKGYRMFDKDIDASGDTKGWADLMKKDRPALPYVYFTRGGAIAYEGALPADVPSFLALLDKQKPAVKGVR